MSIASEITRIQNNIADAYTAASGKGATMPATQNSANLASTIGTISTGGSSGEFLVRVIDYDGSTIKEAHLNTNETFELPSAPTHTGLVFQEWSCPVPIVNGEITVTDQDIIIGPVYTTASGKCEFDITLNPVTGLYVYMNVEGEIDWGDGTTDIGPTDHTYAAYGDYTIKVDLWSPSINSAIFAQNNSAANDICTEARLTGVQIKKQVFTSLNMLKRITLSNTVTFVYDGWSFGNCGVETLIIPSSVTTLPQYFVYNSHWLKHCVLPHTLQTISTYAFAQTQSLESVYIPDSVTTIGTQAFYLSGIKKLIIPASITAIPERMCQQAEALSEVKMKGQVTSIGQYAFSGCTVLAKINFPDTITTFNLGAFMGVWGLASKVMPSAITSIASGTFANVPAIVVDFSRATAVPALADVNSLGNLMNGTGVIKVPSALYSSWIATSVWSDISSHIVAV